VECTRDEAPGLLIAAAELWKDASTTEERQLAAALEVYARRFRAAGLAALGIDEPTVEVQS
jgi:hypothetical protein